MTKQKQSCHNLRGHSTFLDVIKSETEYFSHKKIPRVFNFAISLDELVDYSIWQLIYHFRKWALTVKPWIGDKNLPRNSGCKWYNCSLTASQSQEFDFAYKIALGSFLSTFSCYLRPFHHVIYTGLLWQAEATNKQCLPQAYLMK